MGRHFLHTPGPGPVSAATLQHFGQQPLDPDSQQARQLTHATLQEMARCLDTGDAIALFPASGTGAWEAALTNCLAPGDAILVYDNGFFASKWATVAARLGLRPEVMRDAPRDGTRWPASWGHPVDSRRIEERLRQDGAGTIQAVCIVHNETSTGVVSDVAAVRHAIDAAGHPALLLVDSVSGIGALDYRHDAWGVDVSIGASQKGLMLPPGLGFNVVSERALARARPVSSYWCWTDILAANRNGLWPYAHNSGMLAALQHCLARLRAEGLARVYARHRRWAAMTAAAVEAWGLDTVCASAPARSPVVTAILTPPSVDADALRKLVLGRYEASLAVGLGGLQGRCFRIGHLGDNNDLTLIACLAACEMALKELGCKVGDGVQSAMALLEHDHRQRGAGDVRTPGAA